MSSAGLGALLGAFYLASRESVLKLGRLIPAAAALFGLSLIVLSIIQIFSVSVIIMIFIGAGLMLQTAGSNTILQTITDDDKRGRVMGFYTMAIMGTAPFGSLLAGTVARLVGTPGAIFFGGITCLTGAVIFMKKLPELRKLVHPVYVRMGIIPEVATAIQTASEPGMESETITTNRS